jgi:preprotein translocase subunit SecD
MRCVLLGLALASPAFADAPVLSIEAGRDVLAVAASDIEMVEPSFDTMGKPAVSVRLNPSLDPQMAAFTAGHIGETLRVFVCGELVLEPTLQSQLHTAAFVISVATAEEATAMALRLREDRCGPVPTS